MPAYLPLSVIRPHEFDSDTAQLSGPLRLAAVSRDHGIDTDLWGGTFVVAAGGRTGIHHHGVQQTVAYVLQGVCEIRWGERGEWCS